MPLRDLGLNVVFVAVLVLLKLIVSIVTLSVHLRSSGGSGRAIYAFLGLCFTGTCVSCSFSFPSQTPPSFCSDPFAGRAVCLGVVVSSQVAEGQFCVGWTPPWVSFGFFPSQKLKSAKKNKPSTVQHPSVVDQYLANEVSLGRVAGPFSVPPYPNLHVSSFGVIPKRGQPGKWCLIMDLSSPGGLVSMTGLIQTNSPSWPNMMWRQPTAMCPYTPLTAFFWG